MQPEMIAGVALWKWGKVQLSEMESPVQYQAEI